MTPVAHYATSALVGTLTARVTGIPMIGGLVAFGFHIPMDYVFNEFYQWGEGWSKKILMVSCMVPAIAILVFATILSDNWLAMMVFGFLGILPDVFDTVTGMVINERFLHWDTPMQMQSFLGTVWTESAFAILALVLMTIF